ncbi:NAD-dependent epimerase/dehydratase family protein [Micromonospora lutea]|nr:NAD-dependent epimerase/dehydratase family protein [Micromonospora lutea]
MPLDGYTVPAFDANGRVSASEATWLVGHPTTAPCFRVTTKYGRALAVTGDHSLFRRNSATGAIEPVPVRDLRIGDQVAIASRVEITERDRKNASLLTVFEQSGTDSWSVAVSWAGLGQLLHERRREIVDLIATRRGARDRRSSWGTLARWRSAEDAPLAVIDALDIPVSSEATVRRYAAGAQARLPVQVDLTDDLLWLMGLYVAEGCLVDQRPKNAYLTISCDDETLDRAQAVIEANLGLHVVRARKTTQRGPALYVHSQLLLDLWRHLGLATTEKSIPGWILGLPLSRLKWFLEGYRQGDGVHSGKKLAEGNRHEFSTVSTRLKDDLVVAFARFGLLPSIGHYASTMKKTGDRKYPFWRLTLCNVSPWSPLEWDLGVEQRITADRQGDLVWAGVTAIEPVQATPLVYDFCVPGKENFWAGSAVMAHNTYGPRMRPDDGRAIPTFISQALRGEPITVHGTGNQTRSICYVADLVRGILLLLDSTESGPINCGTEHEMSMRELAETIVALCDSKSEVTYVTRSADDPEKRRPDLTLARELLGYEPTVAPEEGLRRTIEHFRERLG